MVSVGWLHTGLDLSDGGLHDILVLVVGSAGPHVNLAGDDGHGQCSYGVHLGGSWSLSCPGGPSWHLP